MLVTDNNFMFTVSLLSQTVFTIKCLDFLFNSVPLGSIYLPSFSVRFFWRLRFTPFFLQNDYISWLGVAERFVTDYNIGLPNQKVFNTSMSCIFNIDCLHLLRLALFLAKFI